MRLLFFAGLLALPMPSLGQTSCTPDALAVAAHGVAAARAKLARISVPENDPAIPAEVQGQLASLHDSLDAAARATFACAAADTTPEALQTTLATALHANADMDTTPVSISNKGDVGTYGTDLSVQVLPLYSTPRLFKVTFRYGIECGDDNVILVFINDGHASPHAWREQLRWQASPETRIGEALGDFLLVTPLTGSFEHPTWHYVVAHGQPGCGAEPRPSTFDLDLLTPTADPAKPTLDWHFEHPYIAGTTTARLATTEDTIDFQLQPIALANGSMGAALAPTEHFRFHRTPDGQVTALPSTSRNAAAASPTPRSQP